MACGALLADFGKRVLILEQHYVPGGMTHVFQRQGYTWDVGVHAVGEVSSDGRFGRLVQRLGRGKVDWVSLGPVCDEFHYPDGRQIDVADSPEQMAQNLLEVFPAEKESIERYLARVRAVAAAMQDHFLGRAFGRRLSAPPGEDLGGLGIDHWIHQHTGDVLRSLTDCDELIAVLSAQWGYYGADPDDSSFAVHALVVDHFLNGGFYPRGGAAAIARGLLGTVAEAGGWTRVGASVEGLLRDDDGAVIGVRLEDGEEIRAPRVVSAIGGIATARQLLTDADRQTEWVQSIEALEPSPAYLCLYVGLEGDIRQAGASAANRWFFETWRHDLDQWHIDDIPDPIPILYTSFPSLKDPDHDPGPRQRHTAEVVTFVDHDDFAPYTGEGWRRRAEGYEAIKAELTDRLLSQLLHHMPGLESMVRYVELSTPVSTTHFTRATGGAIYGLKPTPERFENPWLKPRTPIEGLFLSGVDVASVGVMGAFIGGVLTAVSMEPVQAMRLFRTLI